LRARFVPAETAGRKLARGLRLAKAPYVTVFGLSVVAAKRGIQIPDYTSPHLNVPALIGQFVSGSREARDPDSNRVCSLRARFVPAETAGRKLARGLRLAKAPYVTVFGLSVVAAKRGIQIPDYTSPHLNVPALIGQFVIGDLATYGLCAARRGRLPFSSVVASKLGIFSQC
jgi:hypothetical protein